MRLLARGGVHAAARGVLAAATVTALAAVPGTAVAAVPGAAPVTSVSGLADVAGALPVASSCRTVGFTPRSVVVGLTPASPTFRATASRCTLRHWELSLGPYDYYTYLQSPRAVIRPTHNSAAGPKDAIVDACNSEFDCTETLLVRSFTLKRRTTWQVGSVDATPEPAHRGSTITVRGRLLIAHWDAGRYVGYGGRGVAVEFRTPTGAYRQVRTATTDVNGWVRTTVPAGQTGVWRLRYGGDVVAGSATAVGDTVSVVP